MDSKRDRLRSDRPDMKPIFGGRPKEAVVVVAGVAAPEDVAKEAKVEGAQDLL